MGKVRNRYAVVQMLCLLEETDRLRQESNLSLRGAAAELGVRHSRLVKWTKDLPHLQSNPRSKKWSSFSGPNRQHRPIKNELLMWIFSQREQGISIKNTLVRLKAPSMLQNSFGAKSIEARFKAVMCFMRKRKYAYRQTTKMMRAPQEVCDEAREFMELTRPLLLGPHRDRCWIFNLDQTPLHFLYRSLKTYAKHGTKTIHMHKSSNGTKRAMRALTVTASGDFLMPMIIFQGKLNGKIVTYEVKNFDPTSIYACQDTAWMDKRCMMMWVEQICNS
jgi:hypothetical protein